MCGHSVIRDGFFNQHEWYILYLGVQDPPIFLGAWLPLDHSKRVPVMVLTPSHKRHIQKSVSWRIISVVITTAIAWWVTGDWKVGAVIGSVDAIIKLFAFFFHERFWHNHRKGRLPDWVSNMIPWQ